MKKLYIIIILGALTSCQTTKGIVVKQPYRWVDGCYAEVYRKASNDTLVTKVPCLAEIGQTVKIKL